MSAAVMPIRSVLSARTPAGAQPTALSAKSKKILYRVSWNGEKFLQEKQ